MRILTYDIEEWFHILDNSSTKTLNEWANYESRIHANMDRILNFLDERNMKATFFCLGWIGEKYPEVIKEIDKRGFEIGSHTHMHQLIFEQNQKEFSSDLNRSVKTLEDITGKKIKSFRAPGFSLTSDVLWAFDELIAQGIEYDSSIFPAARAHGGIADFSAQTPHTLRYKGSEIKEFPINVKKFSSQKLVFSGGGYFRLIPYTLIKRWTRQTEYVMTYFHPRDFDAGQPLIPGLSKFRRFKSYYGLSGAFDKLVRYTTDFDFTDLQNASKSLNWDQLATVEVR